jgi:hypothetical protein
MFSTTMQLCVADSPMDVLPPHVQSPAQPFTTVMPESQMPPLLLYSKVPMQHPRWPLPPQGPGWTHVPRDFSKPMGQ